MRAGAGWRWGGWGGVAGVGEVEVKTFQMHSIGFVS